MYDFDFRRTHQALDRYIVDHSSEPLPYAFRASAYLFAEMTASVSRSEIPDRRREDRREKEETGA